MGARFRPKALVAWSTGKDSAFALWEIRNRDEFDVVGIITTVTSVYDRVSMHGVRASLLDLQVAALGLPCRKVLIPAPCPNEVYEREMGRAMDDARERGVTHVIFGDIFLEDVRRYREERLAQVGCTGVFPLWGRNSHDLARAMLASGIRATITCVDPRHLNRSLAGRAFDASFVAGLPDGVDPCGENGEFHTCVTSGPMFRAPIAVERGEVVERDGFVFADLIPV